MAVPDQAPVPMPVPRRPDPQRPDRAAQPLDVTVVICAYTMRRWPDLIAAVASVRAQRPAPARVLVVSDHDEELRRRAAKLPGVQAIASTGRPGLSGARNTAVAAVTTSLIAFLDDDAVAEPGWLAGICAPILAGQADVVGGRVDAAFLAGRPRWFPQEFDWVVGCTYRGHPVARTAIRNPIGASMVFRTELLGRQPFREGLGRVGRRPLGCEETELCIRLAGRRPGVRIVYEPDAVVRQRICASRETVRYFLSRCYAEGLSKAAVSAMVGTAPALRAERGYVRRVLPSGVWRGLTDTVTGRRPAGVLRSAMITGGFAATTIGFARGRLAAVGR